MREILISLGIKEENLTKILWKTFNIINKYIVLLNNFELNVYRQQESLEYFQSAIEGLDSIHTELFKSKEKFKRKEAKFEFVFTQLKTKLKLI